MNSQCTKMVKTQPKVGEVDRNPSDHRCRRPLYADGVCKQHHDGYSAEKEARLAAIHQRSEARDAAKIAAVKEEQRTQRGAIDEAILLLVKNGYTVTKSQEQS